MDAATEAADALREQRAAEGELTALRREIDERAEAGDGHIDGATAEQLREGLEAARGRLHRARVRLREIDQAG